jgi:hypothetical protein
MGTITELANMTNQDRDLTISFLACSLRQAFAERLEEQRRRIEAEGQVAQLSVKLRELQTGKKKSPV